MTSILDSEMSKGIGKLLCEKQLRVPFYQRSYAWKKEQVRELYEDLRRAIDDGREYYFLGSVVGCQEDRTDAVEIVDGQQRIATTAILLAAIRDKLRGDLRDKKASDKFEEQYLFHESGFRDPEKRSSITLNEIDNDYFKKRVMDPDSRPSRKSELRVPSHRLIEDAAQIAQSMVNEIVGKRDEPGQKGELDKWVSFIRDSARVIWA